MKLKMNRQHYYKKLNGKQWIPKKAFNSVEDIKTQLGFDLKSYNYYVCDVCDKIHIGREGLNKNGRSRISR